MKWTQMRFQDIKIFANFITSPVSSSSKPSWHRHWNVPGVFKQSPCSPHKFGISSHSLVSWHVLWKKEIFIWVIFFAISGLCFYGFAQKILKVIYLLSVWSRTYPGLHPHWTWPSELIQTCSHPPFSFLHSSAVKSEKWISKKECVFFTILVIFWFYLILHNSTIITSPISMHVLKGSSSSNWYPYGQRQWALPNTLMHVCEQPKLLSGRNNTFRNQ